MVGGRRCTEQTPRGSPSSRNGKTDLAGYIPSTPRYDLDLFPVRRTHFLSWRHQPSATVLVGNLLRPRTLRIGAKWGLPREKS